MYLFFYLFCMPMLIISNLMIFFSSSSIYMWMIMEINLMIFISMISFNKFYSELMMNYFLIQSFNSYLFLMSSLMMNLNFNMNFFNLMIFMSMVSKLGMPPFHLWYLKLMKFMNWMLFFINSSIQKFIPMMILNFYMFNNKYMYMYLLMMINLFSLIIPIFSINTFSMKIIMCFSSIIQLSWNLLLMMFNEWMWISYFILYNFLSLNLILMMNKLNINNIFDINSNKINPNNSMFLFSSFLSLAGLPPFTGFINKMMFINMMFNNLYMYLIIYMLISSLISLFFYLRSMIQCTMFFNKSMNINFNLYNKNFKKISLLMNWSMILFMMYEIM